MKGRRNMRMDRTEYGSQVLTGQAAMALRISVSERMGARALVRRQERAMQRHDGSPERQSVAIAMLAVEERIVKALWTLARLPNDKGIGFASRNGVGYLEERADIYANAVAAGGWLTTAPRPAPPSARSIDAMHEPLEWMRCLERSQAKLLTEGAMSRRGDMADPVRWSRIRKKLEMEHLTIRTLQRRYEQALRDIVSHLTLARIA